VKKLSCYLILVCVILIGSMACAKKTMKSQIEQLIEPMKEISHPLLFWETANDKTIINLIPMNTSHMKNISRDYEGFLDAKAGRIATYFLSEDKDGYLQVTRMETDRDIFTTTKLTGKLKIAGAPVWTVTRNDLVAIAGTTGENSYSVVGINFNRKDPEPDPITKEVGNPEITYIETVWLSAPTPVKAIAVSPDGTQLAFVEPLKDTPAKFGLSTVTLPKGTPFRVGTDPVVELGDYSPDGASLLATFDTDSRVELYLIDVKTRNLDRLTNSVHGFLTKSPVWHPGGKYILYATDATTDFTSGTTPISGEQLYLYSLDSRKARRLTSLENSRVWADFAPNGDFLMYNSTAGVPARQAGRLRVPRQTEQSTEDLAKQSKLETWRLYYIPWVAKEFQTSNTKTLQPEEMQFLVSWTVGGSNKVGFTWGPGGELPVQ
jgi:WD40 repeat protein